MADIFERIAKGILERRGYKLKEKQVISEQRIGGNKELGAALGRIDQLVQQLNAANDELRPKKEPAKDARAKWEEMRKNMLRTPQIENLVAKGHGGVLLGKVVEAFLDSQANIWLNLLLGDSNTIIGGKQWRDSVQKIDVPGKSIILNWMRKGDRLTYVPPHEYKQIVEPEHVFLDEGNKTLNATKMLDAMDEISTDNQQLGDKFLDISADQARFMKEMEMRVSTLSTVLGNIETALKSTKNTPKKTPSKGDRGEEDGKVQDT